MAAEEQLPPELPPHLGMVNGIVVPKLVTPEVVEELKGIKLYPDDVWVVSYPKTGTTWTMQILKLIRNNGVPDDEILDKTIPWLEAKTKFCPDLNPDEMKRPRAFKSHFPYDVFPCGLPDTTPCKYIYVMRNPKDVAVSTYFHAKKFVANLEWGPFWERHTKGGGVFGDYFDHILGWWAHRDNTNILLLKYEDMKRDARKAISKIASFIGADISEEVVAKIAELTSFKKMKDDNTANVVWLEEFSDGGFMRKGQVGDWKNFLSAEESTQLDAQSAEKLQGTGLEFDYE